jgi:Leucine Rich repeats (2 copies)
MRLQSKCPKDRLCYTEKYSSHQKTMKAILAAIVIAISLVSPLLLVTAQAKPVQVKSFAKWCQEKNTVPAATKHTINVLLKKAETNDCQKADAYLSSLDKLYVRRSEIVDLQPLASLTNLESIDLGSNQVSNIESLSGLIKLRELTLRNNRIANIQPLAGLTELTFLDIDSNQISDIQPLAQLTKLEWLNLEQNQIGNSKSLAGLNNLNFLKILPQTAPGKANTPVSSKRLVRTLEVPRSMSVMALSRDGQTFIAAKEGSITVWNVATGVSQSHTLLDREYATIVSLAISPDGRTLITGSSGMDIREVSNGSNCSGLSCSWSRSSSSTKSRLGSAIQLWEINTGKGIGMLEQSGESLLSELRTLEFSDDGKTLSAEYVSAKGLISAWDLHTGKQKPESYTVYPSAKPKYLIESSGGTAKVDIYSIN